MAYILLTSAKHDKNNTRSFNEFKTTDDLAKALVNHFEDYLLTRERCDTGRTEANDDNSLEYKSDELYQFLDEFFSELVCLVRQDNDPNLWIPYSSGWIKESCIYIYLRKQTVRTQNLQGPPQPPPSSRPLTTLTDNSNPLSAMEMLTMGHTSNTDIVMG